MYIQPSSDFWHGRIDSAVDPLSARYHQKIQLANISEVSVSEGFSRRIGIIGFKCDEGVRRNKGRVGASEAPDAIRRAIAKLPWHLGDEAVLLDVGDVKCNGKEMEEAQAMLGDIIGRLLDKGVNPVILGGGHETFYGHYLGVRKHIGSNKKLGIINIDAHFDMRPYENETSSGTMFKQILDHDDRCSYLCAGIQQQGNTAALFKQADEYGVEYISEEDLGSSDIENRDELIQRFISRHDAVALTICTDAISSAYAPGVSAPSPFGLDPKVVRAMIRQVVSSGKVLSFDISEVNPSLDEKNKTADLAARLVHEALLKMKTGGIK